MHHETVLVKRIDRFDANFTGRVLFICQELMVGAANRCAQQK